MKGTKKIFNVLHGDCDLQSQELQKTVNQLRTVIANAERTGGYVFTHPLYKEISKICSTLQTKTANKESIKALRIIQRHFDRLNKNDFHDYQADELMDSVILDIWDPISDD